LNFSALSLFSQRLTAVVLLKKSIFLKFIYFVDCCVWFSNKMHIVIYFFDFPFINSYSQSSFVEKDMHDEMFWKDFWEKKTWNSLTKYKKKKEILHLLWFCISQTSNCFSLFLSFSFPIFEFIPFIFFQSTSNPKVSM